MRDQLSQVRKEMKASIQELRGEVQELQQDREALRTELTAIREELQQDSLHHLTDPALTTLHLLIHKATPPGPEQHQPDRDLPHP